MQGSTVCWRRGRVMCPGNHQTRCLDLSRIPSEVRISQHSTASSIPLRICRRDHSTNSLHLLWMLVAIVWRKPSCQCRWGQCSLAGGIYSLDALLPDLFGPDPRRGVCKNQPIHAILCMDSKPEANKPSQGHTADARLFDLSFIHQFQHIASQLPNRE